MCCRSLLASFMVRSSPKSMSCVIRYTAVKMVKSSLSSYRLVIMLSNSIYFDAITKQEYGGLPLRATQRTLESTTTAVWLSCQSALREVLSLLSCSCKRTSQPTKCSCIDNRMHCTDLCSCEECQNKFLTTTAIETLKHLCNSLLKYTIVSRPINFSKPYR